jgi:hypothetical protein
MRLERTTVLLSGILASVALAWPGGVFAQAPPGPITPPDSAQSVPEAAPPARPAPAAVAPRGKPTIIGTWKLNLDESDDPRKKLEEARNSSGGGYGGGHGGVRVGGGWPGGGYPGGGGGGYGGHRGGSQGVSDEDRARMAELLHPADSLSIAQKEAEVDLTDDQGRKRVYYTDGRKLEKSKDANNQELAAKWDHERLTSEEKGPHGGKITRSFAPSPDGTQLYETLNIESSRSNRTVYIRYVYDRAPQAAQVSKP